MTNKKPIKKNLVEKKAPNYEPDIGRLHNLVRAEVAVQLYKMEECEVRDFDYSNEWYSCSQDVKNIINIKLDKHLKDLAKRGNVKQQYTKYIIRSIISSLGLGATAMFLILNNL